MDKKSKKRKLIYFLGIIPLLLFAGCAPGPPPPPLFPGFEWLIVVLVIILGIFLGKKYSSSDPQKTDYLTEALNAINQQLEKLEKKIDELEKSKIKERKNKSKSRRSQ